MQAAPQAAGPRRPAAQPACTALGREPRGALRCRQGLHVTCCLRCMHPLTVDASLKLSRRSSSCLLLPAATRANQGQLCTIQTPLNLRPGVLRSPGSRGGRRDVIALPSGNQHRQVGRYYCAEQLAALQRVDAITHPGDLPADEGRAARPQVGTRHASRQAGRQMGGRAGGGWQPSMMVLAGRPAGQPPMRRRQRHSPSHRRPAAPQGAASARRACSCPPPPSPPPHKPFPLDRTSVSARSQPSMLSGRRYRANRPGPNRPGSAQARRLVTCCPAAGVQRGARRA